MRSIDELAALCYGQRKHIITNAEERFYDEDTTGKVAVVPGGT